MKAAIHASVSTVDQEPENQLLESRDHCKARGWTAVEYVDRLGRSLKHCCGCPRVASPAGIQRSFILPETRRSEREAA